MNGLNAGLRDGPQFITATKTGKEMLKSAWRTAGSDEVSAGDFRIMAVQRAHKEMAGDDLAGDRSAAENPGRAGQRRAIGYDPPQTNHKFKSLAHAVWVSRSVFLAL